MRLEGAAPGQTVPRAIPRNVLGDLLSLSTVRRGARKGVPLQILSSSRSLHFRNSRAIMKRVAEARGAIAMEQERTTLLAAAVEREIEEMILGVRPILAMGRHAKTSP